MYRVALIALVAACHGGSGPKTPAADGVRAYLAALKSDDPRAAYRLLAEDARQHTSYDDFALAWKESQVERAWQAKVLGEAVHGNPDVGERALASFSDGKLVALTREGAAWHLESELVTRARALRPRDAVRMFADAIAARDVSAVLGALTERRRGGLQRQVEGFVTSIGKHVNGPLEELSDRAELRWDEGGIRYRIVLRKDKDDWRVDDIYIRPIPKTDEEPGKAMHEDPEDDLP